MRLYMAFRAGGSAGKVAFYVRSYFCDWMRIVDEHISAAIKAASDVGFRDSEGPPCWEHTPANSVKSG